MEAEASCPTGQPNWAPEKAFVDGFKVSSAMIDSITALGQREGVKLDSAQLAVSRPAIELIVKGLVGRDIFEQSTYYRVVNPIDPIYRRALDIINDEKTYGDLLGGRERMISLANRPRPMRVEKV